MPDEQQPSSATPEEPEEPEDEIIIDAVLEPIPDEASAPTFPTGPTAPDTGYDSAGVPTFESVREKIETRFGTAIGATELAEETPEGRSVAEQYEARERAAAERLQQIRESMSKDES